MVYGLWASVGHGAGFVGILSMGAVSVGTGSVGRPTVSSL